MKPFAHFKTQTFAFSVFLVSSVSSAVAVSSTVSVVFAAEPEGQVQGFYNKNGKIVSATSLPEQGIGFVGLFRQRERYFGSQGLVDLIQSVASEMSSIFPQGERLQIGDIAAEHGGFIKGHGSHQNGLDVDIAYFRVDRKEQAKEVEGFPLQFVKDGKLTSDFDLQRNFALLTAFMASGRVNRMFVDPVIKQEMCNYAKKESRFDESVPLLSHLRPLENHANHVHVRITCPKESSKCESQDEVPAQAGCDFVSLFGKAVRLKVQSEE